MIQLIDSSEETLFVVKAQHVVILLLKRTTAHKTKFLPNAVVTSLILIYIFVSVMCALCEKDVVICVGYSHKAPEKLN